MDALTDKLDWALVQSFLAVAETGTLSAAARQLGASQPTLGRQIKAIEQQLGEELFVRQARGLALTEAGERLVPAARDVRDAINRISIIAAGQQQSLSGTVRITASELVSHTHLPSILADIRSAEPQIELELVPSDSTENLLFREADIAIRMYQPEQLDLVARQLGYLEIGAFASTRYLEQHGRPTTIEEFASHQFVGYDRNEQIIAGMRSAGFNIDRHFFHTRCDNQIVYWELVRQGCGIGFSQKSIADNDPLVEQIPLDFPIAPLPVWLTAHKVMQSTPRIKRVWNLLRDGLQQVLS
jgi:DNA-binding transcriptional LysR family regulator